MKKVMFIFVILSIYLCIGTVTSSYDLIPEDAIRIRVIANSDEAKDQAIKEHVRDELGRYFYDKLKDTKDSSSAKEVIREHIPEIKELITATLGNNDYRLDYGVNYFPEKEYKGIAYKEGYYQSLVVTLGQGLGANWWCILFPPLCLIEGDEMSEVEYRSLVSDIVNRYF